jgi:membrane-associated phospholipid phosphatase
VEPPVTTWTSRLLEAVGRLLGRNRRRILELFLGVFVPLCLFAVLAREVVHVQPPPWDVAVLTWLHAHGSPAADRWMIWASRIGIWYGLIPFSVLLAFWLLARREVSRFSFFVLSMLGSWLLNVLTKQLFGRERPALWPSPAPEESFSFPSGHAMGSMSLAAAVGVLAWRTRYRWAAVLGGAAFTLLVSGSRLYLGVHYPTDVLGAWLASLAWVLGLRQILLARGHR